MHNAQTIARQLRRPQGDLGRQVGDKMNESNAPMYELTLREMGIQAGDSILEIGYGNGAFFPDILAQTAGGPVAGIDFSKAMWREASQRNAALCQNGQLALHHGDARRLPFADNTFDKVFCINVIYFWKKPAAYLLETKRVLRPGGVFFACFRPKTSLEKMPFAAHGFVHYDESSWGEVLEKHGFKTLKTAHQGEKTIVYQGASIDLDAVLVAASARQEAI